MKEEEREREIERAVGSRRTMLNFVCLSNEDFTLTFLFLHRFKHETPTPHAQKMLCLLRSLTEMIFASDRWPQRRKVSVHLFLIAFARGSTLQGTAKVHMRLDL